MDDEGEIVAQSDPSHSFGASVTATVKPGRYFIVVESNARFDGNLGQYTVFGTVPQVTKPTKPGGFQVAANSPTEVRVTWKDAIGESNYLLYWYNHAARHYDSVALTANSTGYTVPGLTPGVQYSFYLAARNGVGSSWADPVRVTMPPTAFTNFRVRAVGNNAVELAWSDIRASSRRPDIHASVFPERHQFWGWWASSASCNTSSRAFADFTLRRFSWLRCLFWRSKL